MEHSSLPRIIITSDISEDNIRRLSELLDAFSKEARCNAIEEFESALANMLGYDSSSQMIPALTVENIHLSWKLWCEE